jgi:precorrin-6A/cobalt-precorrin-6A reductase
MVLISAALKHACRRSSYAACHTANGTNLGGTNEARAPVAQPSRSATMQTVLVLGGTAEARILAGLLVDRGTPVVSTLAGRVQNPRLPPGEVRIGGFGGIPGLVSWLRASNVAAIVDATHPFASRITASAAAAATQLGLPIVLLRRPSWTPTTADNWTWVSSLLEAANSLSADRIFLTTGRQGLPAFAPCPQWFLIRCVDPPPPPLPKRHHLLLARGPYTPAGELNLMRSHEIETLITKDSGGDQTSAKLTAARTLNLPVIMIRRPPTPDIPTVSTVAEALTWLDALAG